MAKSKKLQLNTISQDHKCSLHKVRTKRPVKSSEKKEWENAVCSVCMEFPHNAILLLCSSYEKGCRPYMCATNHRFSNCLEQYKKAYTKSTSDIPLSDKSGPLDGKTEKPELLCPLCRGEVKGWTVVDPARKYLNSKKRTCMQDECSFVGNYKQLKKHVKSVHPMAPRPRDVDPTHLEKWKKLENERERSDVFSTIRSTMPGAVVIGDYVIERNFREIPIDHDSDDYLDGGFFRFPTYVGRWGGPEFGFGADYDSFDEDEFGGVRARGGVVSRRAGSHATRNARSRTRLLGRRRVGRPRTRR